MAWQIARKWGNRRFVRPAPVAEVLAAVLLHDSGWSAFDSRPDLDPSGRPRTFDAMETPVHLDIWRESVHRTAQVSRYAALLVADHHRMLARRKLNDLSSRRNTDGMRLTRAFDAEMGEKVAAFEASLENDPRYEHALRGPGRRANGLILAACDRLSVWLCAGMAFPVELPAMGRGGEEHSVAVRDLGEGRLRMDPWPLEGTRAGIRCEGRRVDAVRFESPADFHAALDSAPVEPLCFELLRPSATGRNTTGGR